MHELAVGSAACERHHDSVHDEPGGLAVAHRSSSCCCEVSPLFGDVLRGGVSSIRSCLACPKGASPTPRVGGLGANVM